jgi:hypothetical protein
MNTLNRTQGTMSRLLVLGVTAALAVVFSGCGSTAPAPCQIQSSAAGPYTVKLTNAGAATANCPAVFGDLWTFDPYAAGLIVAFPNSTTFPLGTASIYGKGKFTATDPDANDLCTVASLTNMEVQAGTSYDVSNLQFLSTALYIGTEFQADVTYHNGGEDCTYKAQAIIPTHSCTTNADCDPTAQPINSGINPLYAQGCNTETWATDLNGGDGICFFTKDFPSLGSFTP